MDGRGHEDEFERAEFLGGLELSDSWLTRPINSAWQGDIRRLLETTAPSLSGPAGFLGYTLWQSTDHQCVAWAGASW